VDVAGLYRQVSEAAHKQDKLFAATVLPGFDDRKIRTPGTLLLREDGGCYNKTWHAAVGSGADWVLITSWNEWHEGSEIEPSLENGTDYLWLTAQWVQGYEGIWTASDALQKFYVSGSLENQEDGFVFSIKNVIASGPLSKISKLTVDDEETSLDGVTVKINSQIREANSISWSASLYVSYGATLEIFVPGTLEPGQHTIKLTINAPSLGQLTLPIVGAVR
jgi:hypothetical protein